ncbi:hypothetical protein [Shewanella atlantica]|uniref:Methyl-accepting chemotaxis protein n=1 Tax=Shewanella atlantica TaxID=271099 RepID=A0A431WCL3_9GAMM|nr:hypothetical protein [Shewanella atlantica]RTR33240.1 hypothetical protein EKG39_05685 [Shewanella atlantica]
MEIGLTHILLAAIGMGILVIIIQVVIFNKLKQIQAQTSQQLAKTIEGIPSMVQDLIHSGVEEITSTQQNHQNKNQQSLKAVNQLVTANIQAAQTDNTKMHSQLQQELSQVAIALQNRLQQLQEHLSTQSTGLHKQTNANLTADLQHTASHLDIAIKRSQTELGKEANNLLFTHKQQQLSNLETLSSLIQNLRVQNLVELTNELAQHTELKVDTSDFVKHLGECKVVKIEDKHTGQMTQVYYENGIKHSSDTLQGEQLKYQMFYDLEGKLVKGIEYGDDQQVSFEYLYDDAGEISQRLEYVYDANGKQTDPIKKVY